MSISKETYDLLMLGASIFSAIGTVGAVGVALWLARTQNKSSVRVRVTFSNAVLPGRPSPAVLRYLSIGVTNTGARDIVVHGVEWHLGRFRKRYFYQTIPTTAMSRVPRRIPPGELAHFLIPRDDFEERSGDLREEIHQGWWRKHFRRRVRAGVYLSSGESIMVEPDREVLNFLYGKPASDPKLTQPRA